MRLSRLLAALGVLVLASAAQAAGPEAMRFPSADGTTSLVGYLFLPEGAGP